MSAYKPSELAWFAGCLGLAGETDPDAIARVALLRPDKPVHFTDRAEETVNHAYRRIFGRKL